MFLWVDTCVQGLSLSHIIASASRCFSSLLWPAPVHLLNRVSSPLKTWATLVPPSKTLRGTTQLLFIHSALKTRSDPLTPPNLQPVHQTQPVARPTAGFHSFLCFFLCINVASLKSSKIVLNVLCCESAKNVIANDKQWTEIKWRSSITKLKILRIFVWSCVHVCICVSAWCVRFIGWHVSRPSRWGWKLLQGEPDDLHRVHASESRQLLPR